MEALPTDLLDELDLVAAVHAETGAVRNRIPPEPWREPVRAAATEVASWIADSLAAETRIAPNVIVSARKDSHATRPVPNMGILERVAYRALAQRILRSDALPDRSHDAYRAFVYAPIANAWERHPGELRTVGNVKFSHVVTSDIASFYEYVDHDLLARELRIQTGDVEAISFLQMLLQESQGRTFGLPQLYDASDWLSDYYIRTLERDLSRRGLEVWRYNDDFRIGCASYGEALEAIERLSEAARAIGLTINDHKTFTPQFFNYLVANTNLDFVDETTTIDPDDVEPVVFDYTTAEEEDVDLAAGTLSRLGLPPTDSLRIDLTKTKGADLVALRRALSTLASHEDPRGLDWVVRLFEFIPSLTPHLVNYLIAVWGAAASRVEELFVRLRQDAFLSEWQAIWLIFALRELHLLQSEDARKWARLQRDRGRGGLLAAEASLALALAGDISFDDLDVGLRMEPEVLAPWYVLGIAALRRGGRVRHGQFEAVRETSRLFEILLR